MTPNIEMSTISLRLSLHRLTNIIFLVTSQVAFPVLSQLLCIPVMFLSRYPLFIRGTFYLVSSLRKIRSDIKKDGRI